MAISAIGKNETELAGGHRELKGDGEMANPLTGIR